MTVVAAQRRAAACAVAAVAAAVIAGGCAAQHGAGGTSRPAGGANAPAHAVAGVAGGDAVARDARAAAAVRIPLNVPNSVTARRGVTLTDCAATRAGGHAAGTVTDPGKSAATYTITVFYTTSQATVIGYAAATVHAAPGKATPWQATGHFSAPHGMRCVLRGVSTR
jgi:hypothetical protein